MKYYLKSLPKNTVLFGGVPDFFIAEEKGVANLSQSEFNTKEDLLKEVEIWVKEIRGKSYPKKVIAFKMNYADSLERFIDSERGKVAV